MQWKYVATIATSLEEDAISDNQNFFHRRVLDLRSCESKNAFPINERVVRRLANFQVDYQQMPIDLPSSTPSQQQELLNAIISRKSNVMILAEKAAPLANFCQANGVLFASKELAFFEDGSPNPSNQVSKNSASKKPKKKPNISGWNLSSFAQPA